MPPCTSPDYWQQLLEVVLPQVDVLLQGIVVWVVLRLRTTSQEEQRTLSGLINSVQRSDASPAPRESRRRAPDQKK